MNDTLHAAAQAASAPVVTAVPVGVSVLTLFGVPLQEWVYALTIVWLLVQIGLKLWDHFFYRRRDDR